jgi:two-component system NarL family sensor kinase
MTGGPGVGALRLAAVRAVLAPVVVLGELLVDHPADDRGTFLVLSGAFAAWAAGLLALHLVARAGRVRAPAALERAEPFVDLAAIVALTYTSGGPFSQTGMAFFVLPLLAAARLRPSAALAARDAAIARLAQERGQLAASVLEAEQRERHRLGDLLHDESVQTLALAQQELADYRRTGSEAAFVRARAAIAEALRQLRGEIFDLHPYVLVHAGLEAALRALADRYADRTRADISIAVDPVASGPHDELLMVVARELLANAIRHSGAVHVALSVRAAADGVELAVRDDGTGFDERRRAEALLEGHVGLASCARRVEAAGGELVVEARRGGGTSVRAWLPRLGAFVG